MTTIEERREVARRLREIRPCKSGHIEWWRIAQAIGLKEPSGWFGWEKFEPDSVKRLADLVEPSCDCVKCELKYRARCDEMGKEMKRQRGSLLSLADDIELDDSWSYCPSCGAMIGRCEE